MASILFGRATVIWIVLVVLTLLAWYLGEGGTDALSFSLPIIATLMMLVAFFKVALVGFYFMELRHAPIVLKLAFIGWMLIAIGLILGLYWAGIVSR